MRINYSYLARQFADLDSLMAEIKAFIPTGDFTLGKPLAEFEERFAKLIGTKYALGVGSGTDALKLPLKALGIGHGDEVITTANTFIATAGAIYETGAMVRFVDTTDAFCMDVDQFERAITERTKAIMPVQYNGFMADMPKLMKIADKYKLPVVEDACQAILADIGGKRAGTFGVAGGFSLHPLKNLNVWGDGGVIVTSDDAMAEKLRLLRNHGLKTRDEISVMGYNSRLDTLQAIVGNWLIGQTEDITAKRIANANRYDAELGKIKGIRIPPRPAGMRGVYHVYGIFAERRDALFKFLMDKGCDPKIHYPIPLYQQEGLKIFGYKPGDFPVTDRHSREIISLKVDQHLLREEQDHIIAQVRAFYAGS